MHRLRVCVATATGNLSDLVRAMRKVRSGAILLCTILAAANHIGAQEGKAPIRIGSAGVVRSYATFDRGPAAPSMVLKNMSVVLQPGAARRADLEQFVASQQDPASQDFHRWLTPEQFAERFGVSELKFLSDFGFGAMAFFGSALTIVAMAQLFTAARTPSAKDLV